MCNTALPIVDRVNNLISLLTTEEKIGLTGSFNGDLCSDIDAGVPRLNIPNVTQLIEITGTVSSSCYVDAGGVSYCPTVFPAPLALAASFSRPLWRQKGSVTGVEVGFPNDARTFLFLVTEGPPRVTPGSRFQQPSRPSYLQSPQLCRPAGFRPRCQPHCRPSQRPQRCVTQPAVEYSPWNDASRNVVAIAPASQARTPRRTLSSAARTSRRSSAARRRARTLHTCSSRPP